MTVAERVYYTVDKSAFGEGPWRDEPDKVQYVDEATGLPCLVKRHPRYGFLCGYVGVPPEHPAYGLDADAVAVGAHRGVNYAAACEEGDEATAICHVPEPGEPDAVWWFGFDCGHFSDLVPYFAADPLTRLPALGDESYRTIDYVRGECASLAAQLARAESEATK